MAFSLVFEYKKIASSRFPQDIATEYFIPQLLKTKSEWSAFMKILQGVTPNTIIDLDKIPFIFRFVGNYSGKTIFNGHEIILYGSNILAAWTGSEFLTPNVEDNVNFFSGYPIGAVLPFFTAPPDGWISLEGQFYYIEIGPTDYERYGSRIHVHNHPGSYISSVPDGAQWDAINNNKLRGYPKTSMDSENQAAIAVEPEVMHFNTQHTHDGYTEWEGGSEETDEGRPPHVKAIFARRVS